MYSHLRIPLIFLTVDILTVFDGVFLFYIILFFDYYFKSELHVMACARLTFQHKCQFTKNIKSILRIIKIIC